MRDPNWERQSNAAARRLHRANLRAASAIDEAVAKHADRVAAGEAVGPTKMRGAPYVGFVPCTAVGHDFLMFSADDDVIARRYLWHGPDAYERPIVTDWVQWVSNAAVVYDIGAYTGLMSVLAAVCNPTARVEAFEPLERTVERAHINMVANSVSDRVSLHAAAASDTNGSAEINLRRGAAFLGTGGSLYDKSRDYPTITVTETKTIRTVRLDDYLPDGRPDVVKIDVEGHELATLRGMAASIARARPVMVVEVWPHTSAEVLDLLRNWSYQTVPYEQSSDVVNYRCLPD